MKSLLDKLDKLSPREKMMLALMTIFVFSALMDRFVVSSIMSRLAKMDSAIEQSKDDRDYALRLLSREKEAQVEYERIGSTIVKAASPAEAIAEMKSELYDAAKKSGVVINAMDQREARPKSFCDEYVVEITKFDAEMKDLIGFIYRIDSSPGMAKVVRLNIIPGKTRNSVTGSMLLTKVMVVDEGTTSKVPVSSGPPQASSPPKL
ncbi:MAG: hypothetical protein A2283_22440 [Lentisphaerae bacterium RIFOXYA12_FULL_48_11]|nr:MAG: hypothetical protein A2283_22440 [Lentisphaerae bacterium RIFOXYA12_FULL_48_11]